jgi:arylsulfatase A-like enzyme
MSNAQSRRPNLLLIVMDCVRASDFGTIPIPSRPMPETERLRAESVVFPRAVTTSSWTLPSHATLFTGLYPWEHGIHAKGSLALRPDTRTLSRALRELGYATISLSGNGFISPATGLGEGFDFTNWARWWEPYVRTAGLESSYPPLGSGSGAGTTSPTHENKLSRMIESALPSLLLRFPFLFDGFNRLATQLSGSNSSSYEVSPWIERRFEAWLKCQSMDTPVFGFINLIDAHDPYLTDPRIVRGLREWWRRSRVSQLRLDYYLGRWGSGESEFHILHQLYLEAIRRLDNRIGNLIRILKESGRWDNTLLILTSDHGNAFGEDGKMFHGLTVDDSVIRVPMWLRLPHGQFGGTEGLGWASLVDVYPTMLSAAGVSPMPISSGYPLQGLVRSKRPGPAIAVSDGIVERQHAKDWLPPQLFQALDRIQVAVYEDNCKGVLATTPEEFNVFALTPGRDRAEPVQDDQNKASNMLRVARGVVADMLIRPGRRRNTEIEQRLNSWGYF